MSAPVVRSLTVPFPVDVFSAISEADGLRATVARHPGYGTYPRVYTLILVDTDAGEMLPEMTRYTTLRLAVRNAMEAAGLLRVPWVVGVML